MKFLEKIKEKSPKIRKLFIGVVLIILAVPMALIVKNHFKKSLSSFEKRDIIKHNVEINKMKENFEGLKEGKKELNNLIEKVASSSEKISTSSFSTSSLNSTSSF